MGTIKLQQSHAIENGFPIGMISQLATRESWRKEIYRPPYYIHKWWARRLGSIFRAIVLSCCLEEGQSVSELFYQPIRFPDITVFDPFMGSGTTIGEAAKLGCRAIGRDINPVPVGMVTAALQTYSRREVIETFNQLQDAVAGKILDFYKTVLPDGNKANVLYYFWVKVINCPICKSEVELFKSRIFAQHARPRKHPEAKAVCPECGTINDVKYNTSTTHCSHCGNVYDPQSGTVTRATTTCSTCHTQFKTIDAVRDTNHPPSHKMYAKMVLTNSGKKIYLPTDQSDENSYHRAELLLADLQHLIPQEQIKPGYNTNQVLNYNYTHWHQMFNARQLVNAALLTSEIQEIKNPDIKILFAYLFSGTLEFNNMFCSFKGEGTGAVRHMFSHHILKPELMPIEANLWGTPKSSGAFSTLFQSRILRLLDYKDAPFELKLVARNGRLHSKKIYQVSDKLYKSISNNYQEFLETKSSLYLSSGDSSHTDIPDCSVDFVITDPPFFDNVHYSQLADFFYVWLKKILYEDARFQKPSTRSPKEVQDTESENFTAKLTSVFKESHRVLKDAGLLVFTYHHSRVEGWASVYKAVREAGFHIIRTHPVKAEMSVSVSIQQATFPVHFDLIIVSRKMFYSNSEQKKVNLPTLEYLDETRSVINNLSRTGVTISLGDIKVILMGKILTRLANINNLSEEISQIYAIEEQVDNWAENLIQEIQANTHTTQKTRVKFSSSEQAIIVKQARLPLGDF